MNRYKLVSVNTVFDRVSKNFIPFDENNIDYRRYLEWLALGNTPDPIDPPRPPDPDESEDISRLTKKVRRLARRLKALLPDLDINDIL